MKLKKFNFKIVNSTNSIAIDMIKNSNNKSGFISANKQKKGRGRYSKKWISYKGNLFVTIFFTLDKIKLSIKQLTKINCFLNKKLISFYNKKKISIKKPNDLLIGKKKISGILQERINIENKKFLIVGIGINIINSPKIINYPTTNIKELTNKIIYKSDLENKLKLIFEKNLSKMYKKNNKLNI